VRHRKQRRDADARADQYMLARAFCQTKQIARRADGQLSADLHVVVQRTRAAAR